MKIQRCFMVHCALLLLPVLLMASFAAAEDKKKDNSQDMCSQASPASMCNASNTCGEACMRRREADLPLVLCHSQHSGGERKWYFLR